MRPTLSLAATLTVALEIVTQAFVNVDGTMVDPQAWVFNLADGGKSITFGYARGTVLILR